MLNEMQTEFKTCLNELAHEKALTTRLKQRQETCEAQLKSLHERQEVIVEGRVV